MVPQHPPYKLVKETKQEDGVCDILCLPTKPRIAPVMVVE